MELINYDSFTIDQLKSIKDNIDRRLKDNNSTITTPPPPLVCIKVIDTVEIANSLNNKGFIYNKCVSAFRSEGMDSTDEIVEKNSNSASGFIYFGSIYEYYTLDKSSLSRTVGYSYNNYDNDLHGLRPLFLFKE